MSKDFKDYATVLFDDIDEIAVDLTKGETPPEDELLIIMAVCVEDSMPKVYCVRGIYNGQSGWQIVGDKKIVDRFGSGEIEPGMCFTISGMCKYLQEVTNNAINFRLSPEDDNVKPIAVVE